MTITDFIAIVLSVYLLALGSARGFMRSLLGPAALILATMAGIFYYQLTRDLIMSLVIGLLGPILLHLLLKFLLKTFARATNTDTGPGFLSSVGGSLLTFAWGGVFMVLTLILLALLPAKIAPWTTLHHDITTSISYTSTAPWIDKFFPVLQKNPSAAANTSSTPDAQSLAQDPRFQKILQDPETQKEINNHDMGKLMTNPKIMALTQQIMSDPEMIKKVMAAYRNSSNASNASAASNPSSSSPQ
jgi:uncharacterized membrane protein required for colicin V production